MNKIISAFYFVLFITTTFFCDAQTITTVVGGGTSGLGDGGLATDCELFHPSTLVFDNVGNYYITDRDNNRIRKVSTSGIITTIAGTGTAGFNGDNIPATSSEVNRPYGICVDIDGNIYFGDGGNQRIRKINTSGIISTFAGDGTPGYNGDNTSATAVHLNSPCWPILDESGNLYFTDIANSRVRKINSLGIITTIAGIGTSGYNGDHIPATDAMLNQPNGLAIGLDGSVYVTDYSNYRVRRIRTSGLIETIAGTGLGGYSGDGGQATLAMVSRPIGIALDKAGNIYFADVYNNRIRKIYTSGIITTVAGTGTAGFSGDGGHALAAQLFYPTGVTLDGHENIYIADQANNRVRFITSTVNTKDVESSAYSVAIYPNPTKGFINISIDQRSSEPYFILISDILGRVVRDVKNVTDNLVSIQINEPPGFYIINVSNSKGSVYKKVQVY